MAQYSTAKDLINDVAGCVGLTASGDPFASTDMAFVQLITLLRVLGRQLAMKYPWGQLNKKKSFTTVVPGDTGDYDLPTDFGFMIDQTGWELSQRQPMGGPLSAQDWAMVTNNNTLASIYISFRINQNKFRLFPQPPTNGLQINFEYSSRWWVCASATPTTPAADAPTQSSDVIYIDSALMVPALKVRFLGARGFSTVEARKEFNEAWDALTGQNQGAQILALDDAMLFPYLGDRNVPTTRFGL